MHSWEKICQIYDSKCLRHWGDCRSLKKWCLNINYLKAYLVFNTLIWGVGTVAVHLFSKLRLRMIHQSKHSTKGKSLSIVFVERLMIKGAVSHRVFCRSTAWAELKKGLLSFRWINDSKFAGAVNPSFFWPFLVLKERKGNHHENQHMLNLHDYRPCIKTMSKRSVPLNLDKEKICRQKRFFPISPVT